MNFGHKLCGRERGIFGEREKGGSMREMGERRCEWAVAGGAKHKGGPWWCGDDDEAAEGGHAVLLWCGASERGRVTGLTGSPEVTVAGGSRLGRRGLFFLNAPSPLLHSLYLHLVPNLRQPCWILLSFRKGEWYCLVDTKTKSIAKSLFYVLSGKRNCI